MKKTLIYTIILGIMLMISGSAQAKDTTDFSRDELKWGFDIVAQNFGALENSFHTFSLEFGRTPKDIEEMIDTGHFGVKLLNPYTGEGDVPLGTIGDKPSPAALFYEQTDTNWGTFECWFVNPNRPEALRSLNTKMYIFEQASLKEIIFSDDATREEQLVRVYLTQMNDAIDSYEQKTGHIPDTYEDLAVKGDVNVYYINPFTKEVMQESEKLSPGNFKYRKFTKEVTNSIQMVKKNGERFTKDVTEVEEYYEVIGWGKTEPVYYYSNDETLDDYEYDVDSDDED